MKKGFLILGVVLILVTALVLPMAVLADNTGTQNASTSQSTSLLIVADNGTSAVTTITFPSAAAGTDVENPYNDVDGIGALQQTYSATVPIPVVQISNTTGGSLIVTLSVGTWTAAVASERYLLTQSTDTDVQAADIVPVLTADGNSATVATGITIANSAVGHLYLEVTLTALAGKSGTSSLTILGETP